MRTFPTDPWRSLIESFCLSFRTASLLLLCSLAVFKGDAESLSGVQPSPGYIGSCPVSLILTWHCAVPGGDPSKLQLTHLGVGSEGHHSMDVQQDPLAPLGTVHQNEDGAEHDNEPRRYPSSTHTLTQPDSRWLGVGSGFSVPDTAEVCGRAAMPLTAHARIIGGAEAEASRFPWQVLLRVNGRAAGALIADQWVLTAAHVIRPKFSLREGMRDIEQHTRVFLGATDVNEMVRLGGHDVEHIVVHPGYKDDSNDFRHDIALVKLKHPVIYSENIAPVCLPVPGCDDLYTPGQLGFVSGHGEIERQMLLNKLRYIQLPVVDPKTCTESMRSKKVYGLPTIVGEHMFCAGYPEGGRDACSGDSGGAFTVFDQGRKAWVVAGLVSWSIGCGRPKQYGFYTKVSSYVPWINSVIHSH